MNDSSSLCRWGILGAATIARKNWQAIRRSGNGIIRAVASRDAARADKWISENQADCPFAERPEAVGGYDALLARDDIDAVYIPLPTGLRKEWVIKAARAGKHVLSEKPCGAEAADVEEMIAVCREAGVQFMDGVMFMHSDRLPALRTVLDDGESVGQIRRLATQFSFLADEDFLTGGNIRVHSDLEPLGCLGDLGWYNIRFALWMMKSEMPESVTGRTISQTPEGVPTEFSGELIFSSGPTVSFYCSFLTDHQEWAHISGTKGSIELRDFVIPLFGNESEFTLSRPEFTAIGCNFRVERHDTRVAVPEYSDSHETAPETKLFRRFAELVLSGETDDYWPQIALQTQQVMDACLTSARKGGEAVTLS